MKICIIALLAMTLTVNAQTPSFLNADVSAYPGKACAGDKVQLNAIATGGTQVYSYSWTSIPEGYTSILQNPEVTPVMNTVYKVEVNDGSSIVTQSIAITVNPRPFIDLLPEPGNGIEIISPTEISVCPINTISLNAGNPGFQYLWNTGSTEQIETAQTSGISFDFKQYEVTVTDPASGCSSTASLSINFDYSSCSYGIDEKKINELDIYPNPSSDGIFNYRPGILSKNQTLEIFTSKGILVEKITIESQATQSNTLINLQDQAAGLYLVKVTENDTQHLQKIIIR